MKTLQKAIQKARISTINKVLSKAKTESAERIRLVYNIKAGPLKKRIILFRAKSSKPKGHIAFMGKRLRLWHFGARQRKSREVSVKVRKDRGRERLGPNYFLAPYKAGGKEYIGIFKRKGPTREAKIAQRYTVGVAEMFEKEVQDEVQELMKRESADIFRHQLKYYLMRMVNKQARR